MSGQGQWPRTDWFPYCARSLSLRPIGWPSRSGPAGPISLRKRAASSRLVSPEASAGALASRARAGRSEVGCPGPWAGLSELATPDPDPLSKSAVRRARGHVPSPYPFNPSPYPHTSTVWLWSCFFWSPRRKTIFNIVRPQLCSTCRPCLWRIAGWERKGNRAFRLHPLPSSHAYRHPFRREEWWNTPIASTHSIPTPSKVSPPSSPFPQLFEEYPCIWCVVLIFASERLSHGCVPCGFLPTLCPGIISRSSQEAASVGGRRQAGTRAVNWLSQ